MSITIPQRMRRLRTDTRGLPIPFCSEITDGKPTLDPSLVVDCLMTKKCWVCADKLGAHKAFLVEPVCAITRTSVLPPAHLECVMFLADHVHPEVVTLIHVTHKFDVMENSLFHMDEAEYQHFRFDGGEASAEEIANSIEAVFPELLASCGDNAQAKEAICELHNELMEMIPGMQTIRPRKAKLTVEGA